MKRLLIIFLITFLACQKEQENITSDPIQLFTSIDPSISGVAFQNNLHYDRDFNIFNYRNFYNGGGVALGDINNDGLIDIYFTANMSKNRLYLNKGNFKFEDITDRAGVSGERAWSTGVSLADVNGDGLLDIYVCNSGDIKGDNKQNELFINNGGLTFTDRAETYGLADRGYSTHAAFFDYDKDGDLDVYLLNNSYKAIGSFNLRKNERPVRDPVGGDKLYRNDGDRFMDVSTEAGIYGSVIGFGLGVTVGDINDDGWQDIFISNDFFERDYLYMNNGDGTFKETLEQSMRSISNASMGADMADFNNDGRLDIFVTDMLPESDARLKQVTTFENWDKYQYNLQNGYYHQFVRNMLHLNNGDGTFSEISRQAGVEATDWSWGALIFDMDNDGMKDIFIANGIYQDLTDLDYINFISNDETKRAIIQKEGVNFKALIDSMPSRAIANYAFHNQGNYEFSNVANEWGLGEPGHSNGSAFGDMDNDGDLDLVVSNVNATASIYRNNSDTARYRFLKFSLIGKGKNPFTVGTKVIINHAGTQYYQEQMPVRGFQSTVDHRLNFGLGSIDSVDSVTVVWPNDQMTILKNVKTNQMLELKQEEANHFEVPPKRIPSTRDRLFTSIQSKTRIDFVHDENSFVDFDRDKMLYHMLSTAGPGVASGDVNSDGLEDIFIGGAKGKPGKLYLQKNNGQLALSHNETFITDEKSEDVDALFFDADGDGDQDLFVVSGGNEFSARAFDLKDRLYMNDGQGNFINFEVSEFSRQKNSSSCVRAADHDGDGDQDLFVGTRLRPFLYGVPASSFIYQNQGDGNFKDVTSTLAPDLSDLGMITDAVWNDYDGDEDPDLFVVGDWMGIEVFRNDEGKLTRTTSDAGLDSTDGWWQCIKPGDFDNDGDMDFILGNHGVNSRFKASSEKPLVMYINDFDQNGTAEQIICRYEEDKLLPFVLKHDLVAQIPGLKKKYLRHGNYIGQSIFDVFTPEELENSVIQKVYRLSSSLMVNNGDGTFDLLELPAEAQFSPVYGLLVDDLDQDGHLDVLMGGNLHGVKPEMGRYDASYGLFLKGRGDNTFDVINPSESGFFLQGEVREIIKMQTAGKDLIMVFRNNDTPQLFEVNILGESEDRSQKGKVGT